MPIKQEEIEALKDALRPFADAYTKCHPLAQMELDAHVPVSCRDLREAYLLLTKLEGPYLRPPRSYP